MLAPLPDAAEVHVPTPLADALLHAAESLPEFDNREFYSTDLQSLVHDRVRQGSPSGFDWLVGEIRSRLGRRPYCALVQGIRYDEGNRLFVGINRAFGELVARPYEKPRAQLVHYIQPATDLPAAQGSQFESEKLHTDTADWNPPVKLISMLCVRADREGGGRSRVLDIESLREEVHSRLGSQSLEFLATEPVPWPVAPYRGGGVTWRTVLSESNMCWRRYSIDMAAASLGIELSPTMIAALDSLEQIVMDTPGTLDFLMREGELLFVDNHKTLHARTPLANPMGSDRLMIRSWVAPCDMTSGVV
jgi:Taurine catabolism dioxygenase TauD, TfdA family